MGITRDTPSQVAWLYVQIWNGSDEYCWRYRADTILSTDGRTDGQGESSIPPFNFAEARGIITQITIFQQPTNCVRIDTLSNVTD